MFTAMTDAAQLLLSTVPDRETGERIAAALVTERLAACVNILPGVTSIYEWQGEVQRDGECLLLIKTRKSLYSRLESRLLALHPYELPELLAVPLEGGLAGYLQWIQDNTGSN
ncbi:MAG: divalent-cation tolerance protein CutA [Xanthomonadaceae bacterium]|nr:divalent-cation tolerance protein CutA [Xanthomonadaceae bacterium]